VTEWIEGLAAGGKLLRRSIEICRTVLRASLADAVDEGLILRSPAARVPIPRTVAKPVREKEVDAWNADQVVRFVAVTSDHRWAVGFRLCVLYGLRRSEVLALRWDDVDWDGRTVRVDEGLIEVRTGIAWSDGKTARSRRVIPADPVTMRFLLTRRRQQAEERLLAGPGVGRERLHHRNPNGRTGVAPELRPCSGADPREGRAAAVDVARPSSHGGDADGGFCLGHR
jgi:integrase